jgi:hypothetical protein
MSVPASIFGVAFTNCVDTGASRNFLHEKFLNKIQISELKTETLAVLKRLMLRF